MAVIRIMEDLKVKSARIANGVPRVGDQIIVIGCPYELAGSVSTGIISAKNRRSNGEMTKHIFLYQTDAALNPGNSGGPWFNMRGELIALSVTKYMFGDNISFGVPIDYYKKAIK